MAINGFGINANANRLNGDLDLLKRDLTYFQEVGFDYVDIPIHGIKAERNGQLIVQRVQEISELLKKFPFRYTVHAPATLNLMDLQDLSLHKRRLLSSIQFAYAIESNILVCHCGRHILREGTSTPGEPVLHTAEMAERLRLFEAEAIHDVADYAAALGVQVCLENAYPHLDGKPCSYGELIDQLVEQVQRIDKGNVGIGLDLGHAYLSANFHGFDFFEAIELAKPLVKHMHIHDNYGAPCTGFEVRKPKFATVDKGDYHMPIGLGYIPIEEVAHMLKCYEGVFMQELAPHYYQYGRDALVHAREIAARVGWTRGPQATLVGA